ncbi:MAG: hypothetical protein JSS86_10425 [Cyanobacteria bacterium SZAS LIN-2]|nr:hypothetical protein [Cyanobacteria bacterium SZAS LIN-2]
MASKQSSGLTLVHKGLLLIIVPFLFNCTWLFLLNGVLDRTHKLADMERQQSIFIEHLNTVMDGSYQARESLLGYIATRNKKYLSRTDLWIERTTKAVAALTSLPLTTEQRNLANELNEAINSQLSPIENVIKNTDSQGATSVLQDIESVKDSIGMVPSADIDISAHIAKQRVDLDDARREVQKNNSRAGTIVVSGLIGNLLLTVLAVLLLNKELSTRLRVLVENAQRLPKKQELNPPLKGADELAYLDTSLHQASVDLQKAADLRTSLMQMVAHDLRSPLFSCMIALEIILDNENANLSEKGQKQVAAMQKNLDRLITLTNDLLLIEQYENDQLTLELEAENIKEVIDQAISSVSGLAQAKRITLKNLAAQEYLEIDRNRILQVIVNYLSNAIKFSPKNSAVEISTEVSPNRLKVSVRDSGSGISAADKNKLFQKFFQTDEGKAAGGAGLGLTICKSIVKAHGGAVGVASEAGRGAIFWFSVPIERTPQAKG